MTEEIIEGATPEVSTEEVTATEEVAATEATV